MQDTENKRGRPAMSASERKSKTVQFRISEPEWAAIEQVAAGVPVNEWCRRAVTGAVEG